MNQTDIKIIRSEDINDTETNGGRADLAAEVVSGVKFNLLPRVTSSERESGVIRYRKAFMANVNQAGETAWGASAGISTPGTGEDRFYIKPAAQTETQTDITADSWFGCGTLAFNASAGDTSIQVSFKSADYSIPEDALLLIKDDAGSIATLRTSQTAPCAEWNGNIATISLATQLPDSYTAFETYAGVMAELGDLAPSVTDISVVSAGGGFDDSLITLCNAGTEEDTFSVTFESSFSFTVAGVAAGALASGTTASAYTPVNPKTNQPFFSIAAECWSGLFEAGNTVSFSTHPASAGFWIKEVVPAGCPHEPNNSFTIDWLID